MVDVFKPVLGSYLVMTDWKECRVVELRRYALRVGAGNSVLLNGVTSAAAPVRSGWCRALAPASRALSS
jgi:hypothetical protein